MKQENKTQHEQSAHVQYPEYTHVPSEILEGHRNYGTRATFFTRASQEARRELYSALKIASLGAVAYVCTAFGYLVAMIVLQPY